MYTTKVIENTVLFGSTTRRLRIAKPNNWKDPILPGAGVELRIGDVSRPYSFANTDDEQIWTFYIRLVEDGEFNQQAALLKPNDVIEIDSFFHYFDIEKHPKAYYFATGTGIAPFLNALKTWDDYKPQKIYYGAKVKGDWLEAPVLDVYDTLYVASQEPSVYQGHITDYITKDIISPDAKYYVCGLDQMVNDVTSRLIDLGATHDQVSVELFYMKND